MDKRKIAKKFLGHYFKIIAKESGIFWDSDNDAEVADIVDLIIDAAKEEIIKEIKENGILHD